jgi:hypothetical protein
MQVTLNNPTQAGNVCRVVVQVNQTDGLITTFVFLGVASSNPAPKFGATLQTASLLTPLRGAHSTFGSVTSSSKYLYVFGGDNSNTATLGNMSTLVQSSPFALLDGSLDGFSYQVTQLPYGVSFGVAVTLNRYFYLIGGVDETGTALDTILRAQLLVPIETPSLDVDLDAVLFGFDNMQGNPANSSQFEEGVYIYQVSALFDPSDASNPGGESLPGEPLSLIIPTFDQLGIFLILTWDVVPTAVGYRLYRTPVNAPFSSMVLLAETVSPTYYDNGAPSIETRKPLPEGSLGEWAILPQTLTKPRVGHGATIVPSNTPDVFTLFVGLGAPSITDVANAFNDIEYIVITETHSAVPLSSPVQTLDAGGFVASAKTVTAGKMFAPMITVSEAQGVAIYTGGQYGVTFAAGLDTAGVTTGTYEVVAANGPAGDFCGDIVTDDDNGALAYGALPFYSGGGYWSLGGSADSVPFGTPSLTGDHVGKQASESVTAPAVGGCGPSAMIAQNLGNSNCDGICPEPRAFVASSITNSQLYIVGGVEATGLSTRVERAVLP